jgi:hypothetical protein
MDKEPEVHKIALWLIIFMKLNHKGYRISLS